MPSVQAAIALFLVAYIASAMGQGREACPSVANECYYTGAATLPSSASSPSKTFTVGAFFDVHEMGDNAYECSTTISSEGILYLQAFLWGLNKYSASYISQYGVSVGAFAFDGCMRPEQDIEYILSYAQCKVHLQDLPQTNVVAYVGPISDESVAAVGPLGTDLSVPIVAPVANSPELSYENNEFLIKLSPSFGYDVGAVYGLLDKLSVDFVIILYDSNDRRWTDAYRSLSEMLTADGNVCINYVRAITMMDVSDANVLDDIIDELESRQDARYVVTFMSHNILDPLLEAVQARSAISTNSFRFIFTSDIGRDRAFMATKSATVNNTFIVEPHVSASVSTVVNEFAQALQDSTTGQVGSANVSWISTYYASGQKSEITSDTSSEITYTVAQILASVEGIMQGMSQAITECGGNQVCDKYRNQDGKGEALLQQISTAILGSSAQGAPLNTDVEYSIYLYYAPNDNSEPRFDEIATVEWSTTGVIDVNLLTELLDNNKFGTQFSDSSCPNEGDCCVPPTTMPPPTTSAETNPMTTASTEAPGESEMVYVMYPRGQEITGAYMDAERPDGEYGTRFDLNHKWIIALGVLAGLGILCVLIFEIYILYKLLGTRLGNKWRTMWLGQLLLFGVLLCYVTLFAYIPIPTKATCGITRFGVGVSYAICFAVLLVKLMVILTSRSTSDVLLPGDVESPNYLKGIYQFLMFIFAVGVQIVIDAQWLILVPPEAVPVISNNNQTVWVCNHYTWEAGLDMNRMDGWVRTNFENHLLSLVYIMVMIFITTVLSLKSHGIITNHRESVFIGIAAGFSIPIWLAWGLVGGLNSDHDYAQEFGDACIAFGLLCTATLILFAMFLPKVRQLVNMGVEGIYLEDDRDTYYAGSVIMAPPSFKGKGPNSVIYVNNQGIYSEPVVIGNGDPSKDKDGAATHLRHPGSTYSAPPTFIKKADSTYGGSRVLRVTDDLKGRHPQKPRTQSEVGVGNGRPRSQRGTLPRSRSQTNLGAL